MSVEAGEYSDLADVRLLPLSSLHLWARNYRRGAVDKIAASIEAFGFNGALRVWKESTVMAGNHALLALRKLHESGAGLPRHIVEDPAGDWLVPCIDVSHLDKSQAEAFALADNGIQEQGRTDASALSGLLAELSLDDRGLIEATGYDQSLVDAMVEKSGRMTAKLLKAAEEDVPDFDPADPSEQPRLDMRKVRCPHCGKEHEV